jgi:hypothetical protein
VESWFGAKFNVPDIGGSSDNGIRGIVVSCTNDVSRRLGVKGFLFSGGVPKFFVAVVH